MLLFKDEPSDSDLFARLTDDSKAFVDKIREGHDPCKDRRPRDCQNGEPWRRLIIF